MSYVCNDIMRLNVGDIAGVLYATQVSWDYYGDEVDLT